MVVKPFVQALYCVPVTDILQYIKEQVEETTMAYPMTFLISWMHYEEAICFHTHILLDKPKLVTVLQSTLVGKR